MKTDALLRDFVETVLDFPTDKEKLRKVRENVRVELGDTGLLEVMVILVLNCGYNRIVAASGHSFGERA